MQRSGQVHLTVDTTLANERMQIDAYVSRVLGLGSKAPLATEFQAVECEVRTANVERVGSEKPWLPAPSTATVHTRDNRVAGPCNGPFK